MVQGIPHSQKYWWELNLAVGPKITIDETYLGRFKFCGSVRDCHTYTGKKYWRIFNLVIAKVDCQTAEI